MSPIQEAYDKLDPWLKPRFLLSKWEARTLIWGILMTFLSWLPIWSILSMSTVRGVEMAWSNAGIALFVLCLIPAIARWILYYLCFGTVNDPRLDGSTPIWKVMANRVEGTLGASKFPLFPTAGPLIILRFMVIIPLRLLQKPLIAGKPWRAFRLNAPCILFVDDWSNRAGIHKCRYHKGEFHPFIPMKDEKYEEHGRWQSISGC